MTAALGWANSKTQIGSAFRIDKKVVMTSARFSPREWAVLAALMTVGAALRIVAIDSQALWADEALTYIIAQLPVLGLATAPVDPTPPLYYWLHHILIPHGASAAAGRSLSLVAGVLAIPAAYFLGRVFSRRSGGTIAAAWTAVAAPLVDYSQEARAYSLLVLLILLSALALQKAGDPSVTKRRWALAAFVASTGLALYTHFVAFFWAIPALLILRIQAGRSTEPQALRDGRWAITAMCLLALPEIRRVIRYATEANAFGWLAQPNGEEFGALLLNQWLPQAGPLVVAIMLMTLLLLAFRARIFLSDWVVREPVAALTLAALLLQPMMLWIFGFIVSPVVMPRTILPSVPAVGLLLALLLAPLRPRVALAAGGAMILLALLSTAANGPMREKEDWNGAARFLARSVRPESDLIVICPNWKAPALMAATRGQNLAPFTSAGYDRMRLIEDRLGREPDWDVAYFQRMFLPLRSPKSERPEDSATVYPSSFWLISSECPDVERKAVLTWAGPAQPKERWSAPARNGHAGIVIQRWERNTASGLRLVVTR